jgi:hypothetical protein
MSQSAFLISENNKRFYIKSIIFCDIRPYSLVDLYRCFGRTYWLHLQSRKLTKEATIENKHSSSSCSLILKMEAEMSLNSDKTSRWHIPEYSIFVPTVVRTWYPTRRNSVTALIVNLNDSDNLAASWRHTATVKMEVVHSSLKSVTSFRNTGRNI